MVTIVQAKKISESFIKVVCDTSIKDELSEFFKFRAPNFQFSPKYKNKLWDGYIRLFNYKTSSLPLGLTPFLKDFCDEREYSFVDQNNVLRPEKLNESDIRDFLTYLKLPFDDIQIRDYQLKGLLKAIAKKRAILKSPTGSGKSLMVYMIERWYHYKNNDNKTLVIVPTVNLVEQLCDNYTEYSRDSGLIDENSVHKIYSGQSKDVSDASVVISTWQSLQNLPTTFFHQFDVVIGDEAHLSKAKELTRIIESCINAKVKIGATGSLDDTKVHELVLTGLFGEVENLATSSDLMDRNQLAKLSIKCLILKYSDVERKACKQLKYKEELDYILTHRNRNNFVAKLSTNFEDKNTLVLFRFIEHGKLLYSMIEKMTKNRSVYFIDGQTPADERENIRKQVEKENNAIIVASLGVFSTGINIKNLEAVILATPVKSKITVLQSIGRALRIGRSDKAVLYDIADDLSHKKRKNYTFTHFLQRLNIYVSENFSHTLMNVNLSYTNDNITTKARA